MSIADNTFVNYDRLRHLAHSIIRFENQSTLTATGLVHELFLKFRAQRSNRGENLESFPSHFAARMMKQILIDRARSRLSRKKLEEARNNNAVATEKNRLKSMRRIVEFDELLEQLSNELPINAELVRLHVLSEYSIDESAKILGISRATAYRKWQFSKGWMQSRMA